MKRSVDGDGFLDFIQLKKRRKKNVLNCVPNYEILEKINEIEDDDEYNSIRSEIRKIFYKNSENNKEEIFDNKETDYYKISGIYEMIKCESKKIKTTFQHERETHISKILNKMNKMTKELRRIYFDVVFKGCD